MWKREYQDVSGEDVEKYIIKIRSVKLLLCEIAPDLG
jgi:hypothetical protein